MPKFVIQEHAARTLHYDFRLEVGGVLKSWSVPKGLSTDPKQKRLAIETPDHPVSWGRFEGVIPEGEYGAGPVLLWDRGTYRNLRKDEKGKLIPMKQCCKEGRIEVWLEGHKLAGGYALVRFKEEEKQWLVIKMRDEKADARRNPIRSEPQSVKSGKTIQQLRNDG